MKLIKLLVVAVSLTMLLTFGTYSLAVNDRTIAGDTTRFSVGNAYANNIQNAGYDTRSKNLYLNFQLTTTESVVGKTPTFTYYAEVFDGSVGTAGTSLLDTYIYNYDSPATQAGTLGNATAQVNNHTVNLTSFPASYRIVITVKEVTLAP